MPGSGSDEPVDDQAAYYAARAPVYDAVYRRPERAADLAWLAAHLPARLAGRRVLEVACGTGYWTAALARTARKLVATDATAEPLALARARPGCAAVRFASADAYALPAALGQFDGAFAGLWFSHVPRGRRAAFLDSLHARLEPGARVLWLDNGPIQCSDLPLVETDADGNTYQHRRLGDGTCYRVLKNFPTEAELRALLGGRGRSFGWRALDNFWLFEYELVA